MPELNKSVGIASRFIGVIIMTIAMVFQLYSWIDYFFLRRERLKQYHFELSLHTLGISNNGIPSEPDGLKWKYVIITGILFPLQYLRQMIKTGKSE